MSALDPHQLAAGVIDRPTRDVDAFVAAHPGVPPGDVGPLLADLTVALEGEGWTVEVARSHQTFARLVARKGPITVDVDLAVEWPPLFPVVEIDGLPVLAAQDLAARKVLAILDRAEGRDFSDLLALADRFSRSDCVAWAQQLDAGVSPVAVADAFDHLRRLRDQEIPSDAARIRHDFANWAAELRSP